MEPEFYATIKLSTGEELLSKVSYLNDEDSLLLDRPLIVERVVQKKSGRAVEGFHLKEWLIATYDTTFIVNMRQVVTITELDPKIVHFYQRHLSIDPDLTLDDNDKGLTRSMGYIGSVQKTKEVLEKIYKDNSSSPSEP